MQGDYIKALTQEQRLEAYVIGIQFYQLLSSICLCGWNTARGASYYFHSDNPIERFARWCVDNRNENGDTPKSILKSLGIEPSMLTLTLPDIEEFIPNVATKTFSNQG